MLNTIFLIGYMGAGKSAIGKSLSKNNGYKFYDLDNILKKRRGGKFQKFSMIIMRCILERLKTFI